MGRGEGKRGREGGALETSSAIVRWEVGGGGLNAGSGAPPSLPFLKYSMSCRGKEKERTVDVCPPLFPSLRSSKCRPRNLRPLWTKGGWEGGREEEAGKKEAKILLGNTYKRWWAEEGGYGKKEHLIGWTACCERNQPKICYDIYVILDRIDANKVRWYSNACSLSLRQTTWGAFVQTAQSTLHEASYVYAVESF